MSLKEIAVGVTMLSRCSPEQKYRLIFDAFDSDGSGQLDLDALTELIQTANPHLDDDTALAYARTTGKAVDKDFDNQISFAEFLDAVKRDLIPLKDFDSATNSLKPKPAQQQNQKAAQQQQNQKSTNNDHGNQQGNQNKQKGNKQNAARSQQSNAQDQKAAPVGHNMSKKMCKYFLKGKCTKGDQCTYVHNNAV